MKKIVYKSPYISDNFYYFLLLLFMQFLVLMIFIIIVTTSIFKIDFLFFAIVTTITMKTKEHTILIARTSYASISFSNLKYIGNSPQEK